MTIFPIFSSFHLVIRKHTPGHNTSISQRTNVMAPSTVTVVYPKEAKFNMEYYMKTHMPLVQENWGQYGLNSWKVVKIDDANSPYGVAAFLEFENEAAFGKAAGGPEAPTVLGDIPNFSDKQPVIMPGSLVGAS